MQKIKEAASEFLASKRVAVTGVSRQPGNHGSNVVYKRLRERGYQVFAVNPNAAEVEGDPCYHDLRSIPGGVEAVVIATKPETAEETMHECADLGVEHVWMHRGPGAGSVSPAAADYGSAARHRRDRRRLPLHVRSHRRPRAQGDAGRLQPQRQRPKAGLTGGEKEVSRRAAVKRRMHRSGRPIASVSQELAPVSAVALGRRARRAWRGWLPLPTRCQAERTAHATPRGHQRRWAASSLSAISEIARQGLPLLICPVATNPARRASSTPRSTVERAMSLAISSRPRRLRGEPRTPALRTAPGRRAPR